MFNTIFILFTLYLHKNTITFTYHICISLPLKEQRHGNMASDGGQPSALTLTIK